MQTRWVDNYGDRVAVALPTGGFTPNPWSKDFDSNNFEDKTGASFLFSLTNKEKYICTTSKHSISYLPGWAFRFGDTKIADLTICNKCN